MAAFTARGARVPDWMLFTASDLSFETGDWKGAREYLDQAGTHPAGRHASSGCVREAELALGVGQDEDALRRPGGARAARGALVRAPVDRRVRDAEGRVSATSPRAGRRARGRGERARPDRAVHRRRGADRPRDRGRDAGGGGHRPARARPARARRRARRAGPSADPHAAAARRGRGGRTGGARLEGRRAPPSWPAREAAPTRSCGSPPPGSGTRSRVRSSARSRCGGPPRRTSTPATAPRRPRPLRLRSSSPGDSAHDG